MDDSVEDIVDRTEEIFGRTKPFAYITRGEEFQEWAVGELEDLIEDIQDTKEEMKKDEYDEENANIALCLENTVDSLIEELKLYVELKNDSPNSAWEHIVNAEMSVEDSIAIHEISSEFDAKERKKKLDSLKDDLFPMQLFNSVGGVVEKATCNICEGDYDTCKHVKKLPYNGEQCVRKIEEFDVNEVSLVSNPALPMARWHVMEDSNGDMRDVMTWRVVETD